MLMPTFSRSTITSQLPRHGASRSSPDLASRSTSVVSQSPSNKRAKYGMARCREEHGRVTFDMVFGATVFGVVGAAIGYYWGTTASLVIVSTVGVAFGFLIGLLGGRRFFVSIVCGAILGGGLAWLVSGTGAVPLGAASGGAVGGFLGVQLGMLIELRQQSKASREHAPPPSEGENLR